MAVILTPKNLSELIKNHRKRAGLTQLELAELAGVGKTLVFNVEKNLSNIQLENLMKILKVLNIKILAEAPE